MLSRDRSHQHKLYIPSNARENQYLIAKFTLTEELLEKFSGYIDINSPKPYEVFYQHIAHLFFDICDKYEIDAGQFVANDKFIRVRYCPEKYSFETDEQVMFLYSPKYHSGSRTFIDGARKIRKFKLVFLATGPEVRHYSAQFHTRVQSAMQEFSNLLELKTEAIRLCDHQHLTYDLFAKSKGVQGVVAHKLRSIAHRFSAHGVAINEDEIDSQTYAIVNLQVNKRVQKLVPVDPKADAPYIPLYQYLFSKFEDSCKDAGLVRGFMNANDLVPVVRTKADSSISQNGSLQIINFNKFAPMNGFESYFADGNLVDSIQFVLIATRNEKTNYGYGKFINDVQNAMRAFADKIDHDEKTENLAIRVQQHIGCNI